MAIAIYNRTTNRVLTIVTAAKGALPEGYEFVDERDLPAGWTREEPPKVLSPEITAYQFLKRLTKAERKAFYARKRTNDDLEDLYTLMLAAGVLVRADPDFQEGVAALVATGILSESRKNEVMEF